MRKITSAVRAQEANGLEISDVRILILDDEQGIIDSLSLFLKKHHYEFDGVTDPFLAVELIRNGRYDMLVLDYMMEGINGDKVVEIIRQFNREIYILLLTGHKDEIPPLLTLRTLEIQGYCEKSDRLEQLILLIESGIKSIIQMRSIKKIQEEANERLKLQVAEKTAGIRNLLDNAGQGFLTFGTDLKVEPEYSYECIQIFRQPIDYSYFPELIYPDNPEQKDLLGNLLLRVLTLGTDIRRDAYMSLLPKTVSLEAVQLKLEFKVIRDPLKGGEKILVILTDITEQQLLKNQIEQERNILKMVVRVAVNQDLFYGFIKDYHHFCAIQLPRILGKNLALHDKVVELFRIIHSFKGNFAQLEMLNTVTKLHQLESELFQIEQNADDTDTDAFENRVLKDDWTSCLREDLAIIEGIMGKDFLNRENTVVIDKSLLDSLEREVVSVLPPRECAIMIDALRRLTDIPFRQLLQTYPNYVMRLAEQQGKSLLPFRIEGGDILVNATKYHGFVSSLIHVFRNIVDHGLETSETRLEAGKPEYGKIKCLIDTMGEYLRLVIADDGAGIGIEKLKEYAVQNNAIPVEQLGRMTDPDLINIIFRAGFTTKESVSPISGRGMGLAAVLQELDNIGGSVQVNTHPGLGTEFVFLIPVEKGLKLGDSTPERIVSAVLDAAIRIFNEKYPDLRQKPDTEDVSLHDILDLEGYTSFILLRGVLGGVFCISADETLIADLAPFFLKEGYHGDGESDYKGVLAEYSNIIIGNSLKYLAVLENLLMIGPPVVLNINRTVQRLPAQNVWRGRIRFDSGSLRICFIKSPKWGCG